MFTGIVTHIGTVRSIEKHGDWRIHIAAENFTGGMIIGASVACSGVCLTATAVDAEGFHMQVSSETLARTTIGQWKEGSRINLERALKVGDELGGHFMSGHVDGLATLAEKTKVGDSFRMAFDAPPSLNRFIAEKGSVALDGVSLTVNAAEGTGFEVNVIPHTLQATTLGAIKAKDSVNLEIDIIARYLARLQRIELC